VCFEGFGILGLDVDVDIPGVVRFSVYIMGRLSVLLWNNQKFSRSVMVRLYVFFWNNEITGR
jgi:hypothetical protein